MGNSDGGKGCRPNCVRDGISFASWGPSFTEHAGLATSTNCDFKLRWCQEETVLLGETALAQALYQRTFLRLKRATFITKLSHEHQIRFRSIA